ncbi:hypothetical protein FGI04_11435 [Dickeya ananatis]|uniref:hypothetical protein n=1 Tax=Dickeya ananatis TaxID=3061286 RepID=UPI001CE5ED91|nr:hypothetical protein [Pectobacterium carotovorum]MCL6340535.1 hypothetical protein [Pectobacterium carotovorum subsp. carotovorum]MCL6344835.1 hypothetical protein [Pectobacterium carotovorum subsp. carotovorum]QYM96528.1 hypothetical protein FGI04_11435 [Dickeya zeae]
MNTRKIVSSIFLEIQKEIESLSDVDIKKIESGDFTIAIRVVKNTTVQNNDKILSEKIANELLNELKGCKNREIGYEILSNKFKTRKELEFFAKKINVYIMKQDKIDKVKEKIIEGVIGASLRSSVIQGE